MAGGKRRNQTQIAPSTASRQDGTPIATGSGGGGGGGAPAAHAATHQNAGSDEVNVAGLSGVLADPQPPIIGAGAAQAVAGNDARLTNARTPTAHHATHEAGGSDPVVLAAADLSNGVTGSGAVVLAVSPALTTNPTAPTQAASDSSTKIATTAFVATAVANAVAGVNPAVAVEAATAAVLQDAPTYANGVGGVGATLTAGSLNTTLVVDGYTPALNDRILVKNQASAFQNGVYVVTQLGAIGLAWILRRASDFNSPSDMNDTGAIPVINGTVNLDTSWVLTSHVTTVGTDALTFTKFSINPTTIVTTARQVLSGTGLTGGGDLSADRTLAADFGSGAGKVTQGNDARLSDARTPIPAGSTKQVQFNDAGVQAGDADFVWDKTTNELTIALLNLTGGQIKFPATQNASSDPNTLDDYEEGDFTVGLTGDGGGSGQTYSFQLGKYIKKGLEVTVTFHFKMTSIGTVTGNSIISGFPFASENVTNEIPVAMLAFDTIVTSFIVMIGVVNPNASFGQIVGRASAGTSQANVSVANIGANGEIKGTMVYRAQG